LALASELDHPLIVAHSLNWGALLFQLLRNAGELEDKTGRTLALAKEHGFANYATDASILRAWHTSETSHPLDSTERMGDSMAARQSRGTMFLRPYYLALLAQVFARAGKSETALDVIAEANAVASATGEVWIAPELVRIEGELLLSSDANDIESAERAFTKAIALAQDRNAKSWELRAATSLARLWADQGRRDEARDVLAPVFEWFSEGFETADLRDAKALISNLR